MLFLMGEVQMGSQLASFFLTDFTWSEIVQFLICGFFCFLCVLGFERRTLRFLGRHYTT
jgi:hypothetical protein